MRNDQVELRRTYTIAILISALSLVGCGLDKDATAAAHSMIYDSAIKNCEESIPLAEATILAEDSKLGSKMMLLSARVDSLRHSLELLNEDAPEETSEELEKLLWVITPKADEADGYTKKSLQTNKEIERLFRIRQADSAFQMVREWEAEQRWRAESYLSLFENLERKLKVLRDRDPNYISG